MAERISGPSFSSETRTITLDEVDNKPEDVAAVELTLRKPKTDKGVKWSTDTVDNEHLNKKKSKCCCIYEKPRNFGESSSESDDECENCFGHVELKRKKREKNPSPSHAPPSPAPDPVPAPEPGPESSDPPAGSPLAQTS